MQIKIIFISTRRITLELIDAGIVHTDPYEVFLNHEKLLSSTSVIQSLQNLSPDTEYQLEVHQNGSVSNEICFRTDKEFVTLDVRDFGAKGDGVHDDTLQIQAAINCCPENSRVLIPEGRYHISSLFLKSNLVLEIAKGAILSASTDYRDFAILPGLIQSYDEQSEYNLGTWEGNPLAMFSSIITGVNVSNVVITGEGEINGNASFENWWKEDGRLKTGGAFRPRSIFLNHCNNITVQGISIKNTPAWTLHPYFSNNTRWIDLHIENPKISPNTDGMDPESVDGLEVVGVTFSLGDDCIAVKSGKAYMGKTYNVPSKNIEIRQCYMRYGHGSVTLGSEIGAGVQNLYCHDCIFEDTDRGLRIKTRRGRGKNSIIDNIRFENIKMNGVLTPFVINSFYWCCDPDGRSEYVRSKEPLEVDERTPSIRCLSFKNIEAHNCHASASFLYGLPERKIEELVFENIHIDFAENPIPEYPAMMADVEKVTRQGIFIRNCKHLVMNRVDVQGTLGSTLDIDGIDNFESDMKDTLETESCETFL